MSLKDVIDPLSLHVLFTYFRSQSNFPLHKQVNKRKFERNNSLEYYHTAVKWVNKTYKVKRCAVLKIIKLLFFRSQMQRETKTEFLLTIPEQYLAGKR